MTFLNVYLQINILLVVVLAFPWLTKKLPLSSTQTSRIMRVLFLSALTLPLILAIIPKRQLPKINFSYIQPGSEAKSFRSHRANLKINSKENYYSATPTNGEIFQNRIIRVIKSEGAAEGFSFFLILSFALLIFAKLRGLQDLKKLIGRGVVYKKLGRVLIVITEEVSIPFSVLLGKRAIVVLPAHILANDSHFKIACRHEIQHHRQRDTLWALGLEASLCFFYINPAIYFLKRKIMEYQELLCDEILIGHKKISTHDYGSCLVGVAEAALECHRIHAGTACMGANTKNPIYFKSFLRRRIEMLSVYGRTRFSNRAGIMLGTVAVLMIAAVAFSAEQSLRNEAGVNPGAAVMDEAIQKIAEKILSEAVKSEEAASAFAIVAEPGTGRILAVANVDTNKKRSGHWALSETFEPASVAKTLVAAKAIDQGLTSRLATHNCENGSYQYAGHTYQDWKKEGFGTITTEKAIAVSSDICSIKIAEKVGKEGLMKMLEDFGFGPGGSAKTFPEARVGQIPQVEDSKNPQLVPSITMGFGYLVSPLEMVQAYGAIANGGNLMTPQAADSSESQVVRRVLSQKTSEEMKEILKQVVLTGTGHYNAESTFYTTAGKTATAYSSDMMKSDNMGGDHISDMAAFIGFAPVANPRVEVFVIVRNPRSSDGAHGSRHAAPVFKRIAEETLRQMKVAPDKM